VLKKSRLNGRSHQRLPQNLDLSPLLLEFRSLLGSAIASAPQELARAAQQVASSDSDHWLESANACWNNCDPQTSPIEAFLLHVALQPVAEHFAVNAEISMAQARTPLCPFCGRKPVCGILRPEGDGARRSLLCSFCSTEWDYRRLICPACEQEEIDNLPVYTAEEFAYIRIEACDLCKAFIKTVDLTKDGRAIPVVDEIASLPLTLWAESNAYRKVQRNILLM